jgi:hypothetical protein
MEGDLYFGKTKGDRDEAETVVQEINNQRMSGGGGELPLYKRL